MEVFSLENLVTLGLLTLLQGVLGLDNMLYIALESKRAPADRRAMVRRWGIAIAIVLRIVLLFALTSMIRYSQAPVLSLHRPGLLEGDLSFHSIIVLLGGAFIVYTATKEILHMVGVDDLEHEERGERPLTTIVLWIVAMNLVFSFDSILGAMALTDVFWVMATAIVIGGLMMIFLADSVATFLQRNRMYEVLGLFILFVVGIMLLSEGGHLAHLRLLGNEVTPMSKTTFYFVIGVLVLTDIVQSRYQRRLLSRRAHLEAS
jgi:predicted tellurium resistance membrane protein TerC